MKYTIDRFKAKARPADPPREGEVADGVAATARLSQWAGRLERVIDKIEKKQKAGEEAKKSMALLMERARSVGEVEDDVDVMGNLLSRVLKFVGKKVLKAIVRPILQFAARVAMNVVKVAARAALRFIIWPAMQLVGSALMAALASPVGWIVLGGAALLGGGYFLLKNRKPEIIEVDDTPATGAVVEQAAPEIAPEVAAPPPVEPPKSKFEQAIESVRQSAPVRAIEQAVERPKVYVPKKGAKFQGFGDDVDGYIREASALYPILPEDVLRGFIKMEAGWTGNMSPTGAIGTGQFTAGTWNRLVTRGGAQIGMTPITGIYKEERDAKGKLIRPSVKPNAKGNFRTTDDPRFNKRVNTLATGLLAAGNAQMLKNAGLPITGANLYMMHNIGPGIIPVMKGGKASASTLLAMQQNGMKAGMDAESFLSYQKGRFDSAYNDANSDTQLASNEPQMRKGVTVEKPAQRKAGDKPTQTASAAPISGNNRGDLVRGPNNSIVRM